MAFAPLAEGVSGRGRVGKIAGYYNNSSGDIEGFLATPVPEPSAVTVSLIARPEITPELVKRVSERIASGIPIRLALAGEGVTVPEYKGYLFNHPE